MAELELFFYAVLENWMTLMGGVISLAIGIYEKIKDKTIKSNIFFAISFICIFASFFMAWREEHQAVVMLKDRLKAPEFSSNINSIHTGISNNYPTILIALMISNPHGPPSALHSWGMYLKFSDGTIVNGEIPPFSRKDTTVPTSMGRMVLTLPANSYFPLASTQPIPAGGLIEGWFWAVFPQSTLDDIYRRKPQVIIQFVDAVSGKEHEVVTNIKESGNYVPKSWIPQ